MMSAIPVRPLNSIPASPLAVGTIRTYGTGLVIYGVTVFCQNPDRWGGPQYASINAVAAPWVWGAVVGSLGVLVLVGSLLGLFVLRNIGLYGGALWIGVFVYGVLDVARQDPHVSYTNGILLATLAIGMCWVARAREGRPNHARFTPRQ